MKEKDTKRTSFDLSIENSNNLGVMSEKMGSSYSRVINYMLRLFLKLSPEVKEELSDFCNAKIEETTQNMAIMSEFEKQDTKQKITQYQQLNFFFMEGQTPAKKTLKGMRKIYLKDGYVLIPDSDDWVILDNYTKPTDCMYAGVVETREPLDGAKKYHAKHFIYFCNYKYGNEYPPNMDDEIYAACCEKDPSFKDVLNAVVNPTYDGKEVFSNITNLDAYKAAPCPGLFHIVEQGDSMYWNESDADYEPPFGSMIIRQSAKER